MGSSLILVGSLLVGGVIGLAVPELVFDHQIVLIATAAVQLILSVGALPRRVTPAPGDRRDLRGLLMWHYLWGTAFWFVPWIVLAGVLQVDDPALVGFTVLMAMPAAAGLPAYAAAARSDARLVTRFAVRAYLAAPLLTPVLLVVTVGADDPLGLAERLLVTLVAPTLLGLLLRRWIGAIPGRIRFSGTVLAMATACFVFGQSFRAEGAGAGIGWILLIGAGAGLLRLGVTIAVAVRATRRDPGRRSETILSSTSKNDALAATLALGIGGPVAAVPALVHMVACMVVVVVLAGRAVRRVSAVASPAVVIPTAELAADQPADVPPGLRIEA